MIEVVEGAGDNLDCLMLPKVQTAAQVHAGSTCCSPRSRRRSASRSAGSASRPRSRTPRAWSTSTPSPAPSTGSRRIIFGPADFMASINMQSLVVGEQPPGYDVGDAYHYILMRILMAARTHDLQAIDGPVPADQGRRRLPPGRRPVRRARLRRQVGAAPRPDRRGQRGLLAGPGRLRPRRADPRRVRVLHVEAGGRRGAVMLGDEMIDEASRKMALVIAAQGPGRRHDPDHLLHARRGLGGCRTRVRLFTARAPTPVGNLDPPPPAP